MNLETREQRAKIIALPLTLAVFILLACWIGHLYQHIPAASPAVVVAAPPVHRAPLPVPKIPTELSQTTG